MKPGLVWRLVLGLLTFWSPIFVAGLAVWLVRSPLVGAALGRSDLAVRRPGPLLLEGAILIVLLLFTMAALALTSTVYALHIPTNPALTERGKIVWSVVNVTVGGLVMPYYWYAYIWKRPSPG